MAMIFLQTRLEQHMDAKKSKQKRCVLSIRLTGRHSDMYGGT